MLSGPLACGAWERTVQFLLGCSDPYPNCKEQNQVKSTTFDFIDGTSAAFQKHFNCVFYVIVSSWWFYYDSYGFHYRCFQIRFYSGEFNLDDILVQRRPYQRKKNIKCWRTVWLCSQVLETLLNGVPKPPVKCGCAELRICGCLNG